METSLEVMGENYKRTQTVDGVSKPTQLLSRKPIPCLSSSPKKWITQYHIKIAHFKLFQALHLRVRALLTNQAESEEKMLLLQENQQTLILAGEPGGEGKHPYFPVTLDHRSSPRPHTQGTAAPALQH